MGELFNLWDIALYIINIVILFFLLKHFVHKPVTKFLAARSQRISDDMDQAASEKQNVLREKEEYERLIAGAQSEAAEIIAKGRERADAAYSAAIESGKAEARQIVARAFKEVETERRAAYEGMRGDITNMAMQIAEKILKREISAEDNRRIIDEFFEKVV